MKRNAQFLLTVLSCLFTTVMMAQTETDTTFRTQMNYIFANLDKSKVPTGILRDYAMEFTNLENYNGVSLTDSNYATTAVFWQIYKTLISGRISISSTGFVRTDTLDNRWYSYRQPGRITLAGLFFSYARFKDNAPPNYITISGNQLFDKYVSGVWQNPYQVEQTFLVSPSVTRYIGQSFNILLPTTTWVSNTTYTGLSINVSDGLGYRTLIPGTPLAVSYSTTGTKEWTYRLALSGGTYLYGHSVVTVTNADGTY